MWPKYCKVVTQPSIYIYIYILLSLLIFIQVCLIAMELPF